MNKKSFKLIGLVVSRSKLPVLLVACQSETKSKTSKSQGRSMGLYWL